MDLKGSLNIGNYNNHSVLPYARYSLESFKCMITAANHQVNNLRLEDQK